MKNLLLFALQLGCRALLRRQNGCPLRPLFQTLLLIIHLTVNYVRIICDDPTTLRVTIGILRESEQLGVHFEVHGLINQLSHPNVLMKHGLVKLGLIIPTQVVGREIGGAERRLLHQVTRRPPPLLKRETAFFIQHYFISNYKIIIKQFRIQGFINN